MPNQPATRLATLAQLKNIVWKLRQRTSVDPSQDTDKLTDRIERNTFESSRICLDILVAILEERFSRGVLFHTLSALNLAEIRITVASSSPSLQRLAQPLHPFARLC